MTAAEALSGVVVVGDVWTGLHLAGLAYVCSRWRAGHGMIQPEGPLNAIVTATLGVCTIPSWFWWLRPLLQAASP